MDNQAVVVIENSVDCNLKCPACPTRYVKDYPKKFMNMDTFNSILEKISPQIFSKCALMGWGEPLLDPLYSKKLRSLKQAGFYVGSTTNCNLLTKNRANEIFDCGLDHLGISLDNNHAYGQQKEFSDIARTLEMLFNLKYAKSIDISIGINIVLFRTKNKTLFDYFKILKDLPLSGISIIPLTMVPDQKFFTELIPKSELQELQSRVLEKYPELNVSFQYMEDEIICNCRSDVFHNVYIDYLGNVCPCCVLAMSFPSMTFDGQMRQTEIRHFGNLMYSDFEDIWQADEYLNFRNLFARGIIPSVCQCCNSWRILPWKL